jgi:hypothetical protein
LKDCEICHQPYRIAFKVKPFRAWSKYKFEKMELTYFILAIVFFFGFGAVGGYIFPMLVVDYIKEKIGFHLIFVFVLILYIFQI